MTSKTTTEKLVSIADLPLLKHGITAHYEGSIDKTGGNADWDWWLYQDEQGEWVLFDVDGPGCILNFVQHRYPTSEVPLFRFYFDGETQPRFSIKPEEFGKKPPFVEPMAGKFVGDDIPPQGRGPIWVVRSFIPMPFRRSCRVTSSVKLEGVAKDKGGGGWGHVIYHKYESADGVETFTGREDYSQSVRKQQEIVHAGIKKINGRKELKQGGSAAVFESRSAGSMVSLRLNVGEMSGTRRNDLWIRMTWDDHGKPDVECPLGAFFGNEIGNNKLGFLTHGQDSDGVFYSRFPMPFWKSAKVELVNRSAEFTAVIDYEVSVVAEDPHAGKLNKCGYFRASAYRMPEKAVRGKDSLIAEVAGCGHIVCSTLTARTVDNKYVSCEGDVRLYIDGCSTPQIESDGSESHACYGWGFVYPPQCNPFSGYDGSGHPLYEFSETRVHVGDVIPFRTGFRFCLEAGDHNDFDMIHSGVVLYYGVDAPGMVLTDRLEMGNAVSEQKHGYTVQGEVWSGRLESSFEDDVSTPKTAYGHAHKGASEFTVSITPENNGVRLRRLGDQKIGRQCVRVLIDGEAVAERKWYYADRNEQRRWLEDDFDVPAKYTRGKTRITVRLESDRSAGMSAWTEFEYSVFAKSVIKE